MPAPHRRNKGDSLAHHIDTESRARQIDNDRDRWVATRTRKDAQWEASAAALDRATRPVSDLEQRADQARLDYARGKQFTRYDTDVRKGRAKPPIIVLGPHVGPRYWLGHCLDCNRELWVHSPKPRVPLCDLCRGRR